MEITNSEMFERAARRDVTVEDAAGQLLAGDAQRRKQRVAAARPRWIPHPAWTVLAILIVAAIDSFERRS